MSKVADDVRTEISAATLEEFGKRLTEFKPVGQTPPAPTGGYDVTTRLPREIEGGFLGVSADLDIHSKEWRSVVRLLRQQRLQVEAAEAEKDELHGALERCAPAAQESGRALKEILEITKGGDISGDLAAAFARNERTIEELEAVVEALSTNLLGLRTAWEQYARTIIRAQALREQVSPAR
jgi:hypothetical protein